MPASARGEEPHDECLADVFEERSGEGDHREIFEAVAIIARFDRLLPEPAN